MKKTVILGLMAACALVGAAKVQLPALVGDNMVLQQKANARLWGKAAPGKTVTVKPSWTAESATATADNDGRWHVRVATPAASNESYTITISDPDGSVTVNDVLVGEVWLASGQSNMQMPLKGFDGCPTEGGFEEVATSGNYADKIRFITVPTIQSYTVEEDVPATWTKPSPQTAPDYSATAWFYAKRLNDVLGVPVGIVSIPYGGAKVESWTPREILETYPDVSLDPKDIEPMIHYHRPMLMYNAMFAPVKDYTYKGIIWYQGCSNVGAHDTYAQRLATMVEHWRKEIGEGDIPFYAVEIAPYVYGEAGKDRAGAFLREAQWKSLELIPNSGMISTNDLAKPFEPYNIHPSNKRGVGNRLGNLALNKTYGQTQMPWAGLVYKSCEPKGNEMWVAVDMPDGGGVCRNYMIDGFELAGADKEWHPADNVWVHWQTNEIVVSSKEVPEPVAVRYCFDDFVLGTMCGHDFMPLVPFRSDNW